MGTEENRRKVAFAPKRGRSGERTPPETFMNTQAPSQEHPTDILTEAAGRIELPCAVLQTAA
jgi:hypothetical protein